jgi:hypothetical protein
MVDIMLSIWPLSSNGAPIGSPTWSPPARRRREARLRAMNADLLVQATWLQDAPRTRVAGSAPSSPQMRVGIPVPGQSRKVARPSDPGSPPLHRRGGSTPGTRASLSSILSKVPTFDAKPRHLALFDLDLHSPKAQRDVAIRWPMGFGSTPQAIQTSISSSAWFLETRQLPDLREPAQLGAK